MNRLTSASLYRSYETVHGSISNSNAVASILVTRIESSARWRGKRSQASVDNGGNPMTAIARSNIESLPHLQIAVPAHADNTPADQGAATVGLSMVGSRADRIKRFGNAALAIVLIIVAVTAIVIVKSVIWIPHFHP
jgi:hypothetical protein